MIEAVDDCGEEYLFAYAVLLYVVDDPAVGEIHFYNGPNVFLVKHLDAEYGGVEAVIRVFCDNVGDGVDMADNAETLLVRA